MTESNSMTIENQPHKCYFNLKGQFQECNGMKRLLDLVSPKIDVPLMMNLVKGTERQMGVRVIENKKKKIKGIWLSYCPFCQEKIIDEKGELQTDILPYWSKEQ